MAIHGNPDLGPLTRHGRSLFEGAKASAMRSEFFRLAVLGNDSLACAVHAEAGAIPLGLVVSGESLAPTDGPALRTILRLANLLRLRTKGPADGSLALATPLDFPEDYVAGRSGAMTSLYHQMECIKEGRIPVILLGETGVGKEHLAQILHRSSDRSSGPFVAINCAAIPGDLLESEMFGIASGVATGVSQRRGSFQEAHGGTLFLDEVDSMPAALQGKLLRVIEEREVRPVGGKIQKLDVRIVAATNGDLTTLIEEGRFRRDLYYRLAGYELRVPPLRRRREDIPDLVEHFVRSFSAESGNAIQGMSLAAMQDLCQRLWPGNIRELRHEVRRLVYFCAEGDVIRRSDLSEDSENTSATAWVERLLEGADQLDLREVLDEIEGEILRLVLQRTEGNKAAAARFLGVSRNGLRIKLRRLGISR